MSEIEIVSGLLDHYTPIPNDMFRTPGIKSRAIHVFGNMRSNRSGWKTNTRAVAESTGLNRKTVMDALNDLIEMGYVERIMVPGVAGQFATYKYRVFDRPARKADTVPGVENGPGDLVQKTDRAPGPKNGPIKKNSSKKTNKEEPPIVPQGDVRDQFDDFWDAYPKKVGKGQARKAYTTAVKKVDGGTLMEKLELFKAHHEKLGTDKRYIPNASTWLNGERWDDELIESTNDSAPSLDEVLSWDVSFDNREKEEMPF